MSSSVKGSDERDHPMYTHAATFPEQAGTNCPGCNGAGVVGSPGAPCPFCKTHALGQQYRALVESEQAGTKPAEPSDALLSAGAQMANVLYNWSQEANAVGSKLSHADRRLLKSLQSLWDEARAALKPSPEPAVAEPTKAQFEQAMRAIPCPDHWTFQDDGTGGFHNHATEWAWIAYRAAKATP